MLACNLAECSVISEVALVLTVGVVADDGPLVVKVKIWPLTVPNWFCAFNRKKYWVAGCKLEIEAATALAEFPEPAELKEVTDPKFALVPYSNQKVVSDPF